MRLLEVQIQFLVTASDILVHREWMWAIRERFCTLKPPNEKARHRRRAFFVSTSIAFYCSRQEEIVG